MLYLDRDHSVKATRLSVKTNRGLHPFERPAGEVASINNVGGSVRIIHVFAALLCALAFGMDLMEMALGPAYAAIFSEPPHRLASITLTVLLCSVYAGAVVGAPFLGWLADRHGLRTGLIFATFWLSITSLLAATSGSVTTLIVWRALSGVALGGLPPLVIAYMTDFAPRQRRGTLIFWMCAIGYLAPPAAIFSMRALTLQKLFGVEAWRWPLLVGSIICLALSFLLRLLPEAPHWLAGTGREEASAVVRKRVDTSRILWKGAALGRSPEIIEQIPRHRAIRNLLLLASVSATIGAASVSFPLVTGPILLARHVNLSDALLYIGASTFSPIVATTVAGFFVDRVARPTMMMACALMMIACAVAFVACTSTSLMACALVLFAVMTSLYMPTLTTYGAELFRPVLRARATSAAWLANRIAAILAPALLVPLSRSGSITSVGLVLCATLLANLFFLHKSATGRRRGAQARRN